YLDIHCGAEDAVFPHHTNEIAQSECYLGHKWCNYWMHLGFLNEEKGKMSKSNGEFLTVSLLEKKGYNPLDYRFFCLNSYYRKQLLFSFETLDNSKNAYNKLKNKCLSLKEEGELNKEAFNKYNDLFKKYLEDDLNTASCMSVLYDVLKDKTINDNTKRSLVKSFDKVLSLDLLKKDEVDNDLVSYVEKMIEKRKVAKLNKDFSLADSIREELLQKGIVLKDTREGTTWEKE
ncbi:MAG: cysteine--tRNA ligase, partial [Bacilli bacterium]|nr:cysteine--tRNA ligase [Bacilli bacterium]